MFCDSIRSTLGEGPRFGILSHRSAISRPPLTPRVPAPQMSRLLLLIPLLLAACTSYSRHTTTAAFPTAHDATDEELDALLERTGWMITEERPGFHEDPRGFTGDLYELERNDGRGFATLYVFEADVGNGSLLLDVAEDINSGTMMQLIEELRALFIAVPTWRDSGVVFCLDHDPRHALVCTDVDEVEAKQSELRELHGCQKMSWNRPEERE